MPQDLARTRPSLDCVVLVNNIESRLATHGRHQFVETYPAWTRILLGTLGRLLALAGRTVPAFRREQYVFAPAEAPSLDATVDR